MVVVTFQMVFQMNANILQALLEKYRDPSEWWELIIILHHQHALRLFSTESRIEVSGENHQQWHF